MNNGGWRPSHAQGHPGAEAATETEVAAALAIVREAKRRRAALGLDTDLTMDELDQLLPPVNCRRTRMRLMEPRS